MKRVIVAASRSKYAPMTSSQRKIIEDACIQSLESIGTKQNLGDLEIKSMDISQDPRNRNKVNLEVWAAFSHGAWTYDESRNFDGKYTRFKYSFKLSDIKPGFLNNPSTYKSISLKSPEWFVSTTSESHESYINMIEGNYDKLLEVIDSLKSEYQGLLDMEFNSSLLVRYANNNIGTKTYKYIDEFIGLITTYDTVDFMCDIIYKHANVDGVDVDLSTVKGERIGHYVYGVAKYGEKSLNLKFNQEEYLHTTYYLISLDDDFKYYKEQLKTGIKQDYDAIVNSVNQAIVLYNSSSLIRQVENEITSNYRDVEIYGNVTSDLYIDFVVKVAGKTSHIQVTEDADIKSTINKIKRAISRRRKQSQ